VKNAEDSHLIVADLEAKKRTVFIYSPDLNFCFILSTVFQDRYNVVTTTDPGVLDTFTMHHAADLIVVDDDPSETMISLFQEMKKKHGKIPILMLYVYSPKRVDLDREVRRYVDGVLYKPFDVTAITERIEQLLPH
jgi:CheY-like chemotaxis protein